MLGIPQMLLSDILMQLSLKFIFPQEKICPLWFSYLSEFFDHLLFIIRLHCLALVNLSGLLVQVVFRTFSLSIFVYVCRLVWIVEKWLSGFWFICGSGGSNDVQNSWGCWLPHGNEQFLGWIWRDPMICEMAMQERVKGSSCHLEWWVGSGQRRLSLIHISEPTRPY